MKFIGKYLDDTMKWISAKVYAGVARFGSAVAGFTVALLVFITVFWLALSLHLAFVHAFLPVQSHEWPLHLDFSTCPHRPGLCSEPSATITLQDGVSNEVPTPYHHQQQQHHQQQHHQQQQQHHHHQQQQPLGYAEQGTSHAHGRSNQRAEEMVRQQRDKRHRDGGKGKKGGKNERRGDTPAGGDNEELLQRWQEVLDMEDTPSLPNEFDVSPEVFEAALEQRRLRRLKLFHQAKSSMEEDLDIQEDQYIRSPPSCSKPGCSYTQSPENGASTTTGLFARGQKYSISVHLEMPDNEANRRLGMFPVELSLLDGNHAPLTTARRPVLLPYRSSEQRFAWSLLQAPSLVLRDSYPETHELELVLFESFVDDPLQPAISLSVVLRSRFVQVSSCRVSVVASFSGLRRLLHRHPVLSAAIGTLTNMALLLAAITVFWLRRAEKARLRSASALHSPPRQTTTPAIHDVSSSGQGREKVEDLLQEERAAGRRKGVDDGRRPLNTMPKTDTQHEKKGASDGNQDEENTGIGSDRKGISVAFKKRFKAGEEENLSAGGDGKRISVTLNKRAKDQEKENLGIGSESEGTPAMPNKSPKDDGIKEAGVEKNRMPRLEELSNLSEQPKGSIVQSDETVSSNASSARSSKDHTDDEFTLLPTKEDAGTEVRQRITATGPPPSLSHRAGN